MSLPQPDHGVLRKAQRGDERAFSIIVRAYQVPVYNYVLRMVGDRSLAEDLTQEVFLRVFQGLPRFSLRSKFTTWLFQVTKNRVLDELRATERRPRAVVDLDDIPPLEVVDAPFERLEAIDAVWRAVEGLSVDLKMALLLRDVVGLSYGEIADSLEVTLATVKWRIWKAREDVQLSLAREGIEVFESGDAPAVAAPVAAGARAARPALAPPALAARLEPELEPRGEHLRQAGLPHLPLRPFDVVLDAAEARAPRVEVEQEIRGARVAVARLADRSRVEERRARRRARAPYLPERRCRRARRPTGRSAARRGCVRRGRAATSSARSVASAASSFRTYSQIESRAEPWKSATPCATPSGSRRLEDLLRRRLEHVSRPPGRDRGVAAELLEIDRAAHGEVVIAAEAEVGPLGDERAALVRARSVADEIAETPELVRRLRVDRREDGLQRVQVRVDVGDDRDAHRQRRTLVRRERAPSLRPREVTRRRSPQRPAATPVITAAPSFRRPATTTPSSAGASRSSQPMRADPNVACCRFGSDMPAAWGRGTVSSVFVASCTPVVPQTRTTSRTARATRPARIDHAGATAAAAEAAARQAAAISARPAASGRGRS